MAGEGGKSPSLRKRIKASLKRILSFASRRSRSSSSSESGSDAAAASASAPAAPAAPAAAAPAAPAAPAPAPAPAPADAAATLPVAEPQQRPHRRPRVPTTPPPFVSAAERARALFERHGLTLDPSDLPFSTTPPAERVQKDIRMRVHRTCHKCDTPFGSDKTCLECRHRRCKRCPKFPLKKSKDKGKEKVTAKTTAPGYKKRKGDIVYGITIPSRRGGQDLVHKPVRQRVHRKCHRCETDFGPGRVCGKCQHNRCKKCPRSPHKTNKPPGYYEKFDPSDSESEQPPRPHRTYKRPRRRIHWTCSKCSTTFIEKTKTCAGCGSDRDETGIRDPPRKPKFKPTDVEVQRLNDRLTAATLGTA